MDGEVWWAAVHRVAKSWTRLNDFPFTFHFHAMEKEMATHSSVLAWRILGMAEPGGLPTTGSHRVGHDRSDLAAAAAARGILQQSLEGAYQRKVPSRGNQMLCSKTQTGAELREGRAIEAEWGTYLKGQTWKEH